MGKSGMLTRSTTTPGGASRVEAKRPPPRVRTRTSEPSAARWEDSRATWRASPPWTTGGYSHETARTRGALKRSAAYRAVFKAR